MPEFCEVGYSATLAKAQGHNFKGWSKVLAVQSSECTIKWHIEKKASSHSIADVFLTAFHSIPNSDSASQAPLYWESKHEATDPKTSLRSAAQQNTQTQGDPTKLFLLISSEVPHATHVAVLQCLTAIVINSLHFMHFLRLSQSALSVPSFRFLAQTIIPFTKTSGFASEKWFSSTTQSVHKFAHNCMLKCWSFQMSSDDGST